MRYQHGEKETVMCERKETVGIVSSSREAASKKGGPIATGWTAPD